MARRPARDRPAARAPAGARSVWRLAGLGLAAALLFALARLPATLLSGALTRAGLESPGLSGSIWSGSARALRWRGAQLGDLRWDVVPTALLRGRIAADVDLARPDGSARGRVALTFGGNLRVENARVELPLEALAQLPVGLPPGWTGRLSADLQEIAISERWPTAVRGTVDVRSLAASPPRSAAVGSYRAVLPDPQAGERAASTVTARVSDVDGPLAVDAAFTLSQDRGFLLEGTLKARGDTPPSLLRSLQLLGPADADGRRPFSVSGTL